MDESQELQAMMGEQLAALPLVVQRAIASSDLQKNLRDLSTTEKLHLDQWESLEHVVMLTLLGIHPIEELEHNIASEVGVPMETATKLAQSINLSVFEPIREELERQLEHPDAQAKEVSGVEAARNEALANAQEDSPTATPAAAPTVPAIQPATPPPPTPEVKVSRPAESSTYKPGETSAQRAAVHEDPYREPPV